MRVPSVFPSSLLLLASLSPTLGQVLYKPSDPAYTQNFNGLSAVESVTHGWSHNTTLPGWYASFTSCLASNGINSGEPMSYGTIGAGDRALGAAGVTSRQWALRLVNDGAEPLVEFNLAYTGEQWRRAGNAKTLTVEYKVFAAGGGAIGATGYTAIPALSFTSPTLGAGLAIDGNATANRQALAATVEGIAWLPDQELWIRWTNPGVGNSVGVASDDVVFSAAAAPPAGTLISIR